MTPKVSSRSARHSRPTSPIAATRMAMITPFCRASHCWRGPAAAAWPARLQRPGLGSPAGDYLVAGATVRVFAVAVEHTVLLVDVEVGAVTAVAVPADVLAGVEAAGGTGGKFRRHQAEHPVSGLLDQCHVFTSFRSRTNG